MLISLVPAFIRCWLKPWPWLPLSVHWFTSAQKSFISRPKITSALATAGTPALRWCVLGKFIRSPVSMTRA
jgi:hypothetical protein